MSEIREKALETMRKIHREKLESISFENKNYEEEVIILFSELFKKEEEIEEYYILNHPNESRGLDGGTASEVRKLYKDHYKSLDELKKKYSIE